jgi:hypothetical protein
MNMLHSFEKYLHLPDDALMKIRRPIAGTFFLVDYINAQYLKSACWTCDVACWAKMSLMLTSILFTCESLPLLHKIQSHVHALIRLLLSNINSFAKTLWDLGGLSFRRRWDAWYKGWDPAWRRRLV